MGVFDFLSKKLQKIDSIKVVDIKFFSKAWVNTKPIKDDELKGKVVLIYFSSMKTESKDVIRRMNLWHNMFPKDSFQLLTVYSPNKGVREVQKNKLFVTREDINHPVMIDDNFKTFDLFQAQSPPVFYLFDKRQRLRYRIMSAKDLDRIGSAIMKLLARR